MQAYLRAEIGLSGLRAIELQTLPDALPQHVQGRVGLHDLGHGLGDEGLHPGEPVPKGAVQVVCQVNADHHSCMRTTHQTAAQRQCSAVCMLGMMARLDVQASLHTKSARTKQGYVAPRHVFYVCGQSQER